MVKMCIFLVALFASGSGYSADAKELRVGIVPWFEKTKLGFMYKPLMEHLSSELNKRFVLEVMSDYDELSVRMARGDIQVGFFTPKTYVSAKEEIKDLDYLVTHVGKNERGELTDFYEGLLIAKKGSGIRPLADAKGMIFAFTHKESSSGYAYPSAMLAKLGIDYESYFSKVFFLKKHHRITGAIASGSVDLAATWDGELVGALKKHGDVFHVVDKTKPIPNDPVAALASVPKSIRQKMVKIFLELNADHPVMKKMRDNGFVDYGFSKRDDSFYDVVRELKQKAVKR